MGKHTHTITLEMNKTYRHIGFFQSQSFVLGVCCVKISVAFLLMRLAAMTKIKKFLWGVISASVPRRSPALR